MRVKQWTIKQSNKGQTNGKQRATTNKRNKGKKKEINCYNEIFEKSEHEIKNAGKE